MKKNVLQLSVLLLIAVSPAFAAQRDQVEWGAITNGVQLSIRLAGNENKIAINQRVKFLVPMRNVSTNATILFGNVNWSVGNPGSFTFAPGSLMFEVISPSGKNISPVDGYGNRWFGSARQLQPEEAVEFNVDSSHVCEFNEIGTYKIVAKKLVKRFDKKPKASELILVTSNPLSVSVVPESQSTNSPSNPKQ